MEEKLFIQNSKGLKLASILHYLNKDKKYPALILLHGFTGYKEEKHIEELGKFLAENGIVSIRFDCSGSGESEGTFEKDYLMSNYLEDIGNVFNYVSNLEFVDKNKIGIWGHSMGGELAVIFASLHPELKACIAVSATISMGRTHWIKSVLEDWRKTGWLSKETSRNGSQIRIPFSFMQDADKFNALDYSPKIHCPFLTVLGFADDTVLPSNSRKIFEAANEPKELIEIEGMNHDYKKHPEQIEKVNRGILEFLSEYLK